MSRHFDTDRFITEVEQRPAIWDARSSEYNNRVIKGKAWEELCLTFVQNYRDMDVGMKNKAVIDIQRKWKSCRDSFRRELAKIKKSKSRSAADSGRKEYVYFKQLEFLLPVCGAKPPSSSQENECSPDQVEEDDLSSCPSSSFIKTRKRRKTSAIQERILLQTIPKNLEKKAQIRDEDDVDKYFLLSLLPHLRSIPSALKLDVQGELISVLQKYKQRGAHINQPLSRHCTHSLSACNIQTAHTSSNENSGSLGAQRSELVLNNPDISESECKNFF